MVNLVKKYILLRQTFLIKEMYTVLKVYIFKKFKIKILLEIKPMILANAMLYCLMFQENTGTFYFLWKTWLKIVDQKLYLLIFLMLKVYFYVFYTVWL